MPIKIVLNEKEQKVPVKVWTNDIEDEAKQQLVNLATLPFVYKHVSVMPDCHAGKGSTVGTVIATQGAILPASLGVDIGCFTGDTKIPLLNGFQKSLKQLYEEKKEVWVYSLDKNNQIVPGKAIPLKTRKNSPLIEITVSGGEAIRCTPDHKFLLLSGKYKEAKDLEVNDSLMPLYRSYESRDGYESVRSKYCFGKQTYKLVYEHFKGPTPKGHVVHHIDHNRFNNTPENLKLMSTNEHSTHHGKYTKKPHWQSKDFEAKRLKGIQLSKLKPEIQEKRAKVGIKNILKYMSSRPEHFKKSIKNNGKRGKKYLIKYNKSIKGRNKSKEVANRIINCDVCNLPVRSYLGLYNHKKKHVSNHKVISIKYLTEREDVYCLNVDKYHNFALSAGIFVHNCGMIALKTDLNHEKVKDNIQKIRHSIERSIPVGFNSHLAKNAPGYSWDGWNDFEKLQGATQQILNDKQKFLNQLGTLGGGNHFIEICLDKENNVWVMLHSGSRNIGKTIADIHINTAKNLMKKMFIELPDPDLAYLVQGTPEFIAYRNDVLWCQDYAKENRQVMMRLVLKDLSHTVNNKEPINVSMAVNCHHNYMEFENHFGSNVIVTRKGAVRARVGDLAVIPGSMGAKSYIVKGLGNEDSFCSCSHGAGRKMSRTKAKAIFTKEDLIKQTEGVECRKDADIVDEIPGAYKPIEEVMENQNDLVEIVAELKQILCIKG